MQQFKIGAIVDSFKLGVRDGIKAAAELGVDGVQIYASYGEIAPDVMTPDKRKELLKYIQAYGLEVSSLCGELGGHGLSIAEEHPEKITLLKKVLDLAIDLGSRGVTMHIGVIPEDREHPRYRTLLAACNELSKYADSVGGWFGIETGPEYCTVLNEFINELEGRGVGVNYDPANLIMLRRDDEVRGVYTLGDKIYHTHAKDGTNYIPTDPEVLARYFAEGGFEDKRLEGIYKEHPLGKGSVRWPQYIQALKDIHYNGYLTIEREVGDNPAADIALAVKTLRELIDR